MKFFPQILSAKRRDTALPVLQKVERRDSSFLRTGSRLRGFTSLRSISSSESVTLSESSQKQNRQSSIEITLSEVIGLTDNYNLQRSVRQQQGIEYGYLSEGWVLGRNRNLLKADTVNLSEAVRLNGVRSLLRSDQFSLTESKSQGGFLTKLASDSVQLGEATRRVGTLVLAGSESASLSDSARQTGTRVRANGEAVQLTENLKQSGQRVFFRSENIGFVEKMTQNGERLVVRTDDVTFKESSVQSGLRVRNALERISLAEDVEIDGVRARPHTETVRLGEVGFINGKINFTRNDYFTFKDPYSVRLAYYSPLRQDGALLREIGVLGTKKYTGSDTVKLSEIRSIERPPYAQERFYFGEQWEVEKNIEVVSLSEQWRLYSRSVLASQPVQLSESWTNISPPRLSEQVTLQEAHQLTHSYIQIQDIQLSESAHILDTRNTLQISPGLYDLRPGRRRLALRLVQLEEGEQPWAVWLSSDLNRVHYVQRANDQLWNQQTTQLNLLNIPGKSTWGHARSVTLLPGPVVVTEFEKAKVVIHSASIQVLDGVDPVTVNGELYYLSLNRRTLHRLGGSSTALPRRSYLIQSFSAPSGSGALLLDDLDRPVMALGAAPGYSAEPDPPVSPVTWGTSEEFISHLTPIEGTVRL